MASVRTDIVSRSSPFNVREIDKKAKNPWRWEWLEKQIDGIFLRECIRKLTKCGVCYCTVCSKELAYGSRGFVALTDHVKSSKHKSFLQIRKEHFALPGSSSKKENCEVPYGLPPAYVALEPVAKENLPQPLTPVGDRIVNLEAMLLGFMAEKSLPFSIAPDLLNLMKEMSKDKKALNHITMHRNAASYKTRFGLSKTMKEAIFHDLQTQFFSLNLDESTNNSNQKIVTVLVNYMTESNISSKHLSSYSVNNVNSESIFQGLVQIFEENNIPWQNLMSVLMDSCSVMRGRNAGLEVKIRSKCPHLLDINGDSCHHVHNATKQFSKPFKLYIENLCTDIHNDLKWSPDLRAIFNEICCALKIKCTMPIAFISFRWLSVYDAALDLLRLLGGLTVFYFPFLNNVDRNEYLHIVVSIYKACNVENATRDRIRNLQKSLGQKSLTPAGKDRKFRITKKLFDQRLETQLVANLFVAVLSQLKEYVKLFQSNTPLLHILHDKQLCLVRDFFSLFIKAEKISSLKDCPKKIKHFDVEDIKNHLPMNSVFVGQSIKKLTASAPKSKVKVVENFQKNTMKAYVECAKTLQKKMPLENLLLQAASSIDPICRKHSLSLKLMKDLPDIVTNVISVAERDIYTLEVHRYQAACLREPQNDEPVDKWWLEISKRFPLVSKMACAILTCFHGPKVESSFSIMNSFVTFESNRLSVESIDAIQTIKYELMSRKISAVDAFKKKDFLTEEVDKNLCRNMISASRNYRELNKKLVNSNKENKIKKLVSKEAAKKISAKAVKFQRELHLIKLKSKASKNSAKNELSCPTNTDDQKSAKRSLQISHINERPSKKTKN